MQISPFRIEEYMAKHEFAAKYLLSSSDAESQTVQDLLSLEPGAHEAFLNHWCGYTESPGAPWLREVLAALYSQLQPDQLVVLSAAEEAIFVFYHALLTPGDHVIVETPCYESALAVPKSTGAAVSGWRRSAANGWAHDFSALESLIRPNTRAIYINSPHNPTGLLMSADVFRRVLELAARHGIYVFSDEVYRELEHDPATRLPAACDLYERALSLGSVSKAYGLPGLRLGWLACRDSSILQKIVSYKHYTTICASAPSEFLTAVAFRHRQKLVHRNLRLFFAISPNFALSSPATRTSSIGLLPTQAPLALFASSPLTTCNPSASASSAKLACFFFPVPSSMSPVTSALDTAAATCPNL